MGMKHVETGASAPIVILVTGFGAFPGAPRNPSAAILSRLRSQGGRFARLGVRLETALLPVVFDAIRPALALAVGQSRPDIVLHLGLAGRRRTVSVETRAINRAGPLHPDAARRRTPQVIAPGGPAIVRATYPSTRLAVAMRATGVDARRSIDAGDYVCNTTLYLTLAGRLAPAAGFVHVPRLADPAQPRHRTRRRRPSLAAVTTAVVAALLELVRDSHASREALWLKSAHPPICSETSPGLRRLS